MAKEIGRGSVVQLKSGGPKMTVSEVQRDGMMKCIWIAPDAKLVSIYSFHPELLTQLMS